MPINRAAPEIARLPLRAYRPKCGCSSSQVPTRCGGKENERTTSSAPALELVKERANPAKQSVVLTRIPRMRSPRQRFQRTQGGEVEPNREKHSKKPDTG